MTLPSLPGSAECRPSPVMPRIAACRRSRSRPADSATSSQSAPTSATRPVTDAKSANADAYLDADRGAEPVDQPEPSLLAAGAIGDLGCLVSGPGKVELSLEIAKQVVPAHEREE